MYVDLVHVGTSSVHLVVFLEKQNVFTFANGSPNAKFGYIHIYIYIFFPFLAAPVVYRSSWVEVKFKPEL